MQYIAGIDNPWWLTPHGEPIADGGGSYVLVQAVHIDVNGPDARLIAAAPDLLTALKIAADTLELALRLANDRGLFGSDEEYEADGTTQPRVLKTARAAIAKAEIAPASEREKEVQEEKP